LAQVEMHWCHRHATPSIFSKREEARTMWSSAQRFTSHAFMIFIVASLLQTLNANGDARAQNSKFAVASNITVSNGPVSSKVGNVNTVVNSQEVANASSYPAVGRLLANADSLNGLNDVLKSAVFFLPKLDTIKARFLVGDIRIDLSQLRCTSLSIDSMRVESSRASSRNIELNLELTGVRVLCASNWAYRYLFFSNDGSVSLDASRGQSSIRVKIGLESKSDMGVPTESSIMSCKPSMSFDVSFRGGIESTILNIFEDTVTDELEKQVNDLMCDELNGMINSDARTALLGMSHSLGLYTPCDVDQSQIILHDSDTYRQCTLPQNLIAPDADSVEEALKLQLGQQEVLNLNTPTMLSITSLLQNYLGGTANETSMNNTRHDLGINVAVRQLLGATGELSLDMSVPLVSQQPATSLLLKKVVIQGLDSFQKLDIIAPISNWTLGYGFQMRELKAVFELHTALDASGSHNSPGGQEFQIQDLKLKDSFNFTFGISELGLDVAQLLAIDINTTRHLTLGQVLAAPIGCTAESLITANISEMLLTVADMSQPKFDGLVDGGVDSFTNGLVEAVYESYKAPVLRALPNFAKTTGVDTINSFFPNPLDQRGPDEPVANQSQACPLPLPVPSEPRYVNLEQSQLLHQFSDLLRRVGGPSRVNQLIEILTEELHPAGVAGSIEVDKVLDIDGELMDFGHLYLSMSELRIAGLNTVSELSFLRPTSNYSTLLSVALGNTSSDDKTIRAQVSVDMRIEGGSVGDERNRFTFSTSLSFMSFFLDIFAKLDQNRIEALRLEQLIVPDCLLATFRNEGLAIRRAHLALQGMRLGLACSECSNSYLKELSQKWNEQDAAEFKKLTSLTSQLLEIIGTYLEGPKFQGIIDKNIADATTHCATKVPPLTWASEEWTPSKSKPLSESKPSAPGMKLTIGTTALLIMATVGAALGFSCSRCRTCISRRKAKEFDIVDASSSNARQALIFNQGIPCGARVMVVFLLLLALAMFILGHLLLAVTVDIKFSLLGLDLSLNDIYSLNVVKAIEMSWEADAYVIAIGLMLVSVLWPYIRIVSMLLLWCIPPTLVPASRRGYLLEGFDFLAKWSMFDIYTLIVLMLATNLKVTSPTQFQILPPQLYDAELVMSPQMALLCNILAQIVAQVAAHFEIVYHRKVLKIEKGCLTVSGNKHAAQNVNEPSNPEIFESNESNAMDLEMASEQKADASSDFKSVCRNTLTIWVRGKVSPMMGIIAHAAVQAALMFGVTLLLLGACLPTLSITTSGLVGVFMDISGEASRTSSYSLYQLIQDLVAFSADDFMMQCGMGLLAILVAVCTLLVPLVQALIAAILWSWPLTPCSLERLKLASKFISSWSFFEVFLIAVFISTLQIEKLAFGIAENVEKEVGGESYQVINDILDFLQDIGLVGAADSKLLGISADLRSGAYTLMLAAIVLNCIGIFIDSCAFVRLMETSKATKPLDGMQKPELAAPTAMQASFGGNGEAHLASASSHTVQSSV